MKGWMGLCKKRSTCVRSLFILSVILTAFLVALKIASVQETAPYHAVVSQRTAEDYTALHTSQDEHNSYQNKDKPLVRRYTKPIINTSSHVVSTYCGVTYSREMDLLTQEPVKGLPQFKNPCWYEDKIFRCFPYFFIIGASKTGTSDLYIRLLQHPDYVESKEKEPNWFSQRLFTEKMTLAQYLTRFYHSAAQRILQDYTHVKARNESYNYSFLITGDSSTTYHYFHDFWPIMPGNYNKTEPVFTNADYISHFNPRAKIIYSVRNPIDRLWSGFLYTSRGDKSADTFHKVVVEGTRVYRDCFKNRTIRSCVYDKKVYLRSTFEKAPDNPSWKCPLDSLDFKTNIHLRIGLYSVLIKDFLQVFPRNQILIQRLEDRSEDMDKSMREIFKFLEMDQLSSTKMKEIVGLSKVNVNAKGHSRYGDMKNETRRILYEFYKPFNKELAALFGEEKLNYGMQG